MSEQTLEEMIAEIPGDEWWKSYSEEQYLKLAKKMIERGFSRDEAVDILRSAYWCAADCFGGG